jgi:hypothetical protein
MNWLVAYRRTEEIWPQRCSKPIGYNTRFFMDHIEGEPCNKFRRTHMVCRVKEIEANKAKAL